LWRLRANLFFMNFRNEIVYAGALDDNGVPIYGNGARSRHRGVELDGYWQPWSRMRLDATLAASRNTFTRYREHGWDGTTTFYDSNRVAGYPDLIATLATHYQLGELDLSLSARHVGRIFIDNTEDNRRDQAARQMDGYVHRINPAYTVADVALRIPFPEAITGYLGIEKLVLESRINNLLDTKYTSFGYMDTEPLFIPASGRNVFVGLNISF
jgi:iron complex outermembrane recepter protein